jgi:tetratricopeptide (TPR) repeat protein
MEPVATDDLELAQTQFLAGQAAFERGQYRQAIEALDKAIGYAGRNSALGGEAQIWLVNAYQAADRNLEAIALCESLGSHPNLKTRKQSRRMISILKAPKLKLREEWMTKIPDLSQLDEAKSKNKKASGYPPSAPRPRPRPKPAQEPVDLSQVETKDNGFVWIALGAIVLTVAGLVWLS